MEHMFYPNLMEPSFVCRLQVNGLKIIKQRASLVPNVLQDEQVMETNSDWVEDAEEEVEHEVSTARIL